MPILEVSPYKLNLFLQCPQHYCFEYIDLRTAPNKRYIKKKRPELELGNFVHDALTLFFKKPVCERNWQTIKEILKNLWGGPLGEKFGFQSLDQERVYYREALDMLKRFTDSEDLDPGIFQLPKSPPGNSFDDYIKITFAQDLMLGGKIDRIDYTPGEALEIIDYKTGKEKDNNLQLLAYIFITEGIFKKPVAKATYLYLKSGKRESIVPGEPLRQKAREHILQIGDQIRNEKKWESQVSKLCAYCDYVDFCPAQEKIKQTMF